MAEGIYNKSVLWTFPDHTKNMFGVRELLVLEELDFMCT